MRARPQRRGRTRTGCRPATAQVARVTRAADAVRAACAVRAARAPRAVRAARAARTLRAARAAAFALAAAGAPSIAAAHGFGQRFDLPVPLELYLLGAGAAVLLSFAVVAWFLRGEAGHAGHPSVDLLRWAPFRALASAPVVKTIRVLSVVVFLMVVVAGLLGTRDPDRNLAPIVVWVIWWVGVAYASALVGDVWKLLNPWKILFEWAEVLARRFDPDAELSAGYELPARLGVWPAVALFLAFAWTELVFTGSALPGNVATAAVLYSIVTWTGMALFGKDVWLRRGEAFTLAFGLLARFAPVRARRSAEGGDRSLELRPYAVGLLQDERVSGSMMVFVILLLSTVTFDGFTATPLWVDILVGAYAAVPSITWISTLGLAAMPLVFLALYLAICALMGAAARPPASAPTGALELGRRFVLTLVPIALAYHLAHYLTYLLIQGQLIVPVASDPFGWGWNLFGTADRGIDIGVVGPRFAWYTAVIAIVAGHIVAVYLAHVEAQRIFRTRGAALRSQIPMLVLMVAYTVISLWILAQPIVEPPAAV